MGIGLGLGVGMDGQAGPPAGAASNPNRLTSPEDFGAAAWLASGVTVTVDFGDVTHPTADQLDFAASGSIRQTVTGLGAGASTLDQACAVTTAWQRFQVSMTQGGLPYTFSVELRVPSGTATLTLREQSIGTSLRCYLIDVAGTAPTVYAYGAKTEQAASFSAYP